MSGRNGFPWGSERKPDRSVRLIVALSIAAASGLLHFVRAIGNGGRSDFTPLWHAARMMFSGQNPYALIGPDATIHSEYPLYYPATAFVAAGPFSLISSYHLASTAFVAVSTFLLVYGMTRDGWHLLPIIPSIAFLTSATLAQWSIVFTAAVYIPALSFLAIAKPQSALPVIAGEVKGTAYLAAVAGALVLGAVSLIVLPSWPSTWMQQIGSSRDFIPPVFRFAGPLILLALIRWRRPESWLLVVSACVPQTWPPYNGLILFTVARTYRETCFLSLVSSFSWIVFAWFANDLIKAQEQHAMSTVLNVGGYLPAVLLILRRPNTGPSPRWLEMLMLRKEQRA